MGTSMVTILLVVFLLILVQVVIVRWVLRINKIVELLDGGARYYLPIPMSTK